MALLTRRVTNYLLIFLALFLIGTIAFLSTVNAYFSIATSAYITPDELGTWEEIKYGASELQSKDALDFAQRHPLLAKWVLLPSSSPSSSSETVGKSGFVEGSPQDLINGGDGTSGKDRIFRDNSPKPPNPDSPPEKIPRIIHQTWKDTVLPPRWKAVRDECAKMHPDYEYMLWTDASSRQFLVDHYSWFLPVFDNYPYPIQRADAIRYFVLHHYGGIYMDLDIGCLRRFDPLLRFEVILPRTIPVGVSNDLLLSSPGHPFMDQLIHTLVTFNHQYLTHYPTVMFSTGPMFVSASYGIFTSAHGSAAPSSTKAPALGFTGVRILPKSLYGKNAKPGEAPDAFFSHYYGSSWHANDAGFLIFLRDHGKFMMFIGGLIVAYGALRIVAPRVLGVSTLGGGRRRRSTPGRWISLAVSGSGSGSSSGGNDSRRSTSGQRSSNRKSSRQSWGTGGGGGEMRRGNEDDEDFSVPMNASIPKDSPPSSRFLSSNENNGSINSNLGGGGGLGPRSMAAPKPQRLSLPLFELQEDQENENLDSPRDSEGGSLTGASSLLAWVGNSLSRPSSRNDGLDQFSTSPITTTSPSPFKKKISSSNSGTLYLPAYFVNNNSSSSKNGHGGGGLDDDSSTSSSPSISTNGRINDISGHNSSWGVHSRRASATLGNWASGLLPSGWRTPSPSTAFNPSSGIGMGRRESQSNGTRSPSPIHLNGGGGTIDLESLGGGNEKESSLPTLMNSSNAYSSGPFNGAGQGRSFSGNLIPGTSTAASPPPNESQQHQHFSSLSEGFLNIHDKDKVQTLKSPSSIHRNFSGGSSSANQSGSTTPLASQSSSSGDQIGGGGGRLVRRTSNQNLNGSGNHLTSISISSGSMSLSPKHEEPPNLNQDQDGGSHGSDGAPPPPYFDRSLENSVKDDEKR